MSRSREWTIALLSFFASLVVSGLLFAYGYGKLEQRVSALEKHDAELREDWKAARVRIETVINEIEKELKR